MPTREQTPKQQLRDWAQQWQQAERELRAVRVRELRQMSDDEAHRASLALLDLASRVPVGDRRRTHSGLVDQQRLFHRRTQ